LILTFNITQGKSEPLFRSITTWYL